MRSVATRSTVSLALCVLLFPLASCSSTEAETESAAPEASTEEVTGDVRPLGETLMFHASFDEGVDADFARGDATLYTAPSYDERDQATPGIGNPDVEVAEGAGRFGHALRFGARNRHAIFYKAAGNVAFSQDEWNGTVSFWLSLDPATDLESGFCDPLQITDEAYNDAAIWVDFTQANPRQFRLGVFGDLAVWNPDGLSADEHPRFLDRLVIVDRPPFETDRWTHVAITHAGLNTEAGGVATLYLDGVRQTKVASDISESFTWDPARAAIRLGVNYVGLFDELSVFDRALTDSEVRTLFELEQGVAAWHP